LVSVSSASRFSVLLRDLRRTAGLTQEELARSAGVGVRTLRDLETGRAARPQRSTVDLLVAALRLDVAAREAFVVAARARRDVGNGIGMRPRPALIGRDAAIREVAALLDVAALVNVVGLGGMGKTCLALAVCHRVAPRFTAGTAAVAVTEASTASALLASLAAAMGADRLEVVFGRAVAGPALVLLDGVDRCPDAAKAALSRLGQLAETPRRLAVLTTSRHPLGLPDEHEWPVPPLDLPAAAAAEDEVFDAAATRLFLDRLRRVRARPVGQDEAATLKALVRRLGGVPLALELAASRGRVLELEEMLARCADRAANADPAMRRLREAVAASMRRLGPVEEAALALLAACQSRWSIDLAEELLVAAGHRGPLAGAVDVVGLVDRLVSLGLVYVWPEPHELRFWHLDTVREVATELAERAGLLRAAQDRHAQVMASVAARSAAELARSGTPVADEGMAVLTADLRAALDHLWRHDRRLAERLDSDLARWRKLGGASS
jgi:predicted ATPase/DNA-binding XRE family transcriptional regulator